MEKRAEKEKKQGYNVGAAGLSKYHVSQTSSKLHTHFDNRKSRNLAGRKDKIIVGLTKKKAFFTLSKGRRQKSIFYSVSHLVSLT